MNDKADVIERARTWAEDAPDAADAEQVRGWIAAAGDGDGAAQAELDERFGSTLAFGTAGLRGHVGPGTARMNRVVVTRATWGLGTYLLEQLADARSRGVVVAYDGRYSSRRFAEDTAAVLAGLQIPAHVFVEPVPTPVCAFAVTHLDAAAGVMVTASHNPPADNGYKVYWGNGAQIVPPHDGGIAACIARAPALADMQLPTMSAAVEAGLRTRVSDDVGRAYLDGVRAGSFREGVAARQPLSIVYTAMHGVGDRWVQRALHESGFDRVVSVAEQADPDGAFRTVDFPNPEEDGALDRALAEASAQQAELLLANDPDADRIAVVEKQADGAWRFLTGNEVGVLLGADAIENADTGDKQKLVITTLVSSTWLSRVARDRGAAYAETLTGFKWIANVALAKEAEGLAFVHGYEEALGVSVGPLVRDKDGVSAAVRVAELKASLAADGKRLTDRLDELALAHGASAGEQWSVTLPGREGKARIDAAMEALRSAPLTELAGSAVKERADLSRPEGGDGWAARETPPTNALVFVAEDDTRLTARPSGTEPKIKFYLDATGTAGDLDELARVRAALDERLARVRREISERLGLP
jgi:phosphomannomutase